MCLTFLFFRTVKLGGNPLKLCLVESIKLGGRIGWLNWVEIHWDYAWLNQLNWVVKLGGQIGWKSIEIMPGRIGQIGWKSIEIMPGQISWIGWLNWSNWVEIHWDYAWSNQLNWVVELGGNPSRLCLVEFGGNPLRLCLVKSVELGGWIRQIGWKSIEIMPGWIGWSNWVEIHSYDAWSNWMEIHWDDAQFDQFDYPIQPIRPGRHTM